MSDAYLRLSDKILEALNLSIRQKDVAISELLNHALEMSLTRGAGGREFIERRNLPQEVEDAMNAVDALKREAKGQG